MSEHLQCQCQPESTASICPPGTTADLKFFKWHLPSSPCCPPSRQISACPQTGGKWGSVVSLAEGVNVQSRNEKEWGLEPGEWQQRSFLTRGSQLHTASPPGPCRPPGWSQCTSLRPVGRGDTGSNNQHTMHHEQLFFYLPPPFGEQWLARNLLTLEIHTEVPKSF